MIKVPFDWEVFLRRQVIVEFLCDDDMRDFEKQRRMIVDTSLDRLGGGITQMLGEYLWFRFHGGVWVNMGHRQTYENSYGYSNYYHMVYEPGIDNKPVEVGDLL